MASSATVSAPKKRKSFSEYFHSMRGQQLIVTLVFLFVPLVLLFMFTYRNYYSLFNDDGVVGDIVTAEEEMLAVLNRELRFTALKQLFVTAAVLSLENTLLALLPLGFNDLMH
ncbi:MAG: exopolysaccharide Pel transporter PelG, partial [Faecalibacterium sp.]|nr:exopolysaccharide Pel transporter PelG [Faecalibacterium sp.]